MGTFLSLSCNLRLVHSMYQSHFEYVSFVIISTHSWGCNFYRQLVYANKQFNNEKKNLKESLNESHSKNLIWLFYLPNGVVELKSGRGERCGIARFSAYNDNHHQDQLK